MLDIDLRGTVALVTGGSRGIGAATVRFLHRCGASVFFTYRTHKDNAAALASELTDRVAYRFCDVSEHDSLPALVDACVARFGRLDVLVNNAAGGAANEFSSDDYDAWRGGWQHTFAVNVFGAAHLAWLAMQQMRRQGSGGRIINVASRAGQRGEATGAYGASKAALINLTKSIARSCAPDAIVAMAVAPGYIETEAVAAALAQRRAQIEEEIPLGYIATPEDVAGVITFLASPLATYTNGATIDVNGGSYVR